MGVDGQQRHQHRPQDMPRAGKFSDAEPELASDRARGGIGMTRFDADDGQSDALQFVPELALQGTGLEADALGLRHLLRQQRGQCS